MMMETGLITPDVLESLAGTTAFRRGEEYFSTGAVSRLRATDDIITARVDGTEIYQVELRDDGGELACDCTCPRAAEGYFCKHCVAVGLAWLAEQASEHQPKTKAEKTRKRDPWRAIKDYLTAQPPQTLIELLLNVAQRDDRLYQLLLLKAERVSGGGNVVKAYRRAIDKATRIHGFVDWRDMRTFAANIDQVVDSLAELLKTDSAAMLVELSEYAIERIENSLEQVDDSDGEVGDIAVRLGELHFNACVMARPEPEDLAERLFHFEMTLPFGLCSFDAYTYRDALGEAGLHRYREVAEAVWCKIKPRDDKDAYDAHRSRITRIMERLAEASGDIEELVAIKARDLSHCYSYLTIAEIWVKARQSGKALEWAERGLKAFAAHPDNRLRDFLVGVYLKRKRNDEALQLTWVQFAERPNLEAYKKLHAVAGKLAIWPVQRERALTHLAEVIAREAAMTSRWKPKPSTPNYSLRVEIALWEQDYEAGWAAAHQGDCDRNLLLTLAGKLEAARPQEVINLYRRVVPPLVEQTNNTAYGEAIKLIRKVGKLMQTLSQTRQFGDYLAELRIQFKPKRNFIKLLDGVVSGTVK